MKEREVQDDEHVTWKCVQAFSGVDGAAADAAEAHVEQNGGTVAVVCTPSGGTGTRRLALDPEWADDLSDRELLEKIRAAAA